MRRSFDTGRLDSPRYRRLTAGARLLYLSLWNHKSAHFSGLFATSPEEMALATALPVDQVHLHLQELTDHPALCVYVQAAGVVWVCDMLEDQGRGEKVGKAVEHQIALLAKNCGLPRTLIADFLSRYATPLKLEAEWLRLQRSPVPDEQPISYRYPIDTPSDTLSIPHRSGIDTPSIPTIRLSSDSGSGSDSVKGLGIGSEFRYGGAGGGDTLSIGYPKAALEPPTPGGHQRLIKALELLRDRSSSRFVISHKSKARERRNACEEQQTLGLPLQLWQRLREVLEELDPDEEQIGKMARWIGAGGWGHLKPCVTPDYLVNHWHEGLTQASAWDGGPLLPPTKAAKSEPEPDDPSLPQVTARPGTKEWLEQIAKRGYAKEAADAARR